MDNNSKKVVGKTATDQMKEIKASKKATDELNNNKVMTDENNVVMPQGYSNDIKASESENVASNQNELINSEKDTSVVEANDDVDKIDTEKSSEPIIIIGGASEVVFEPNQNQNKDDSSLNDELVDSAEKKTQDKSLRIIEGGGKEIIIDDSSNGNEKFSDTPACTRNKVKDKKIGDYGTYIAIGFFIITIIISLFNIKGMRYPLSCLFLSLAALTMGVTTVLRLLNNKKCGCTTCKTQNKTFTYSAILWFAVFVGAMIAFLVLFLK